MVRTGRYMMAGVALGMALATAFASSGNRLVLAAQPPVILAQHQGSGQGAGRFAELNLTAEQNAAIETIFRSTAQQTMQLLTDDQRRTLQQVVRDGGNPQAAMATLDLSADQQATLQQLRRDQMEQVMALLDDQQRSQLRQTLGHQRPN